MEHLNLEAYQAHEYFLCAINITVVNMITISFVVMKTLLTSLVAPDLRWVNLIIRFCLHSLFFVFTTFKMDEEYGPARVIALGIGFVAIIHALYMVVFTFLMPHAVKCSKK